MKSLLLLIIAASLTACGSPAPKPYGTPFPINQINPQVSHQTPAHKEAP